MTKNRNLPAVIADTLCSRCNCSIKSSDKIFVISATMEDETNVISSLCFPCASALLTEAIVAKNLANSAPISELTNAEDAVTIPDDQNAENEVIQGGTIVANDSDTDRSGRKAALGFEVAEDGFRLRIQCTDGIS